MGNEFSEFPSDAVVHSVPPAGSILNLDPLFAGSEVIERETLARPVLPLSEATLKVRIAWRSLPAKNVAAARPADHFVAALPPPPTTS